MRLLDHERDELLRASGDVEHVHLRARDHHVAHLRLGDLQHALDHRERLGVEDAALERRMQQLDQLLAIVGLAQQHRGQALEQARLGGVVHPGGVPYGEYFSKRRRHAL